MVVPIFPLSLQKHQGISWGFAGGTQDGGASITGGPSNSYSLLGGQYWMCDMSALIINELRRAHYHMWEAISDGGVQPIIVCCREFDTDQPWATDSDRIISRSRGVPFGDGAFFSGGGGFLTRRINITQVGDLTLRQVAFSVTLNYARAGGLIGGEHFTIDHPNWGPRMYRVARAYVPVAGVQQIEIRPPLREDAPAATTNLDFDNPRCTMKISMKDGMRAKFDITRNARPDLTFSEFGSRITGF